MHDYFGKFIANLFKWKASREHKEFNTVLNLYKNF